MQENRLFATAIESLLDGVVIVDADATASGPRILFINTAFTRLTGLTPLDVLGHNLTALAPLLTAASLGRLQEALATGQPFTSEADFEARDGAARHTLSCSLVPLRDSFGRIRHGILVLRDVTDVRRTERLLLQVQKTDSIGLLASGVAHDFNNQLTVIRGSGELVLRDPSLPPGLRSLIQQIVTTSERAAALTRQLLHFSRQQPPRFDTVDLNAVIAPLAEMLKRLLGENTVLDLQLGHDLPRLFGDEAMLEQVIVNLVVNARDALSDGGHIVIETADVFLARAAHPRQQAGRHVRLVVRDDGRGIPPEHLPQIFEPFFTTKAAGEGTGLGLSTVQSIVGQHRGWIDVESAPGRGSSFSVYLPARPDLDPRALSGTPGAASTGPRGGNETILVVEDDLIVRTVTTQILQHFGYKVTAVGSGPEALRAVTSGASRPDLLLADQVLPAGLYGRDVVEALRAGRQELRAIIMSGHTPHADDLAWLQNSRTAFLPKPFSVTTLAVMVRDTLDGQTSILSPADAH
ncbi:MAG TPA: ATP-binding protein [Opitutaceae bacterium]